MLSREHLGAMTALALVGCNAMPESPTPSLNLDPTTTEDIVLQVDVPTDEDGDEVELVITWSVDGVGQADLDNETVVPADRTAKGEVWQARVVATDGRVTTEPAIVSATVRNTAPVATVQIDQQAPRRGEPLSISYTAEDADGDALTYTVSWSLNGEDVDNTTDGVASDVTTRGDVWMVTVIADDGETTSEPVSASVSIENTAPTVVSIELDPTEPRTTQPIVASSTADDADGDAVTVDYRWFVNGDPSVSGDTLGAENFVKGDRIRVEATPSDGFVSGAAFVSEEITIVNTVPTASGALVTPAEAREADTLSCAGVGFIDDDADPAGFEYVWQVDGTPLAEGITPDGSQFDKGDVVTCVATPFDGEDRGEAVSASITIQNTAPELASATLETTAPTEADVLSVTLGEASDADEDEVSIRGTWFVNGSAVGSTATLDGSLFSKGDTIHAELVPNDGDEDGAVVKTNVVTVANSVPSVDSVSLSKTAGVQTEDSLTASYTASDADGDALTVRYAWYVNGVAVGTGATLDGATGFDKGDEVYVEVSVNDGTVDSIAVASSTVEIENSAPSLESVAIGPDPAFEDDILTCSASGWSDPDGDDAGYDVQWTVDGVVVSTAATLDGADFSKDSVVSCELTPNDGEDTGAAVASASLTVSNSVPVIGSVAIDNTAPTAEDTVNAVVSASDLDGDSLTYTYSWKADGVEVGTDGNLDLSTTHRGAEITLTVVASDGEASSSPVTSSSVTVLNAAPSLGAVSISSSGAVRTDSTLEAAFTASDIDGDSLTATYVWKVNGTSVSATGSTLDGSHFAKDDVVTVEVSISDGTATDGPLASSGVTVQNSVPAGGAVSLDGDTPEEDLLCDFSSLPTDPDGDVLTYTVSWELDGIAWTGTVDTTTRTGDTIPAAETEWGDEWSCAIEADDGDDSIAFASSTVGILPEDADVSYGSALTLSPNRAAGTAATAGFGEACDTGEALVGVEFGLDVSPGLLVKQMATRCAPIEISCDLGACTASTGTITTGPSRGAPASTSTTTRDCDDGEVVVGFVGRSGSVIDNVTLRCAPIEPTYTDGVGWSVAVGSSTTDLAVAGGSGGSAFARSDCGSGRVATQLSSGTTSTHVVSLYLGCNTPEIVE